MNIDTDGIKLTCIFFGCAIFTFGWYYIVHLYAFLGLAGIFCLLAVFSLIFFRDPKRKVPEEQDAVVSAADGVVIDVSRIDAEGMEGNEALRIAVFMNIFNVHVNRSPLAGKVVGITHHYGKKLSAYSKRAEFENEYGDTELETRFGLVRVRQIAGLIARRVVIRVKEGDVLGRGERLGLIRFGSRVDVFLPAIFEPSVVQGDSVLAGETIIAALSPKENLHDSKQRKE